MVICCGCDHFATQAAQISGICRQFEINSDLCFRPESACRENRSFLSAAMRYAEITVSITIRRKSIRFASSPRLLVCRITLSPTPGKLISIMNRYRIAVLGFSVRGKLMCRGIPQLLKKIYAVCRLSAGTGVANESVLSPLVSTHLIFTRIGNGKIHFRQI